MIASRYLILRDESTGLFPDGFVGPAKWFRWPRPFVEVHKIEPRPGASSDGEWVELKNL